MQEYAGEFVGTLILILLGDGVVANVLLNKSKGNNAGWIVITTGWGLAVMMAAFCVGRISGAHLNPAVTIGLASIGKFSWALAPGYILAQFLGAMAGAALVWLAYLPHWAETEDKGAKLGVFCNAPGIRSTVSNVICEAVGTAMLLFGALAIGANQADMGAGNADLANVFGNGFGPLVTGFLVWAIGLSLGGPTGYAINPARDLGPRIMHAILPIAGKGDSDWNYAWIPVVGPIIGGVLGAVAFAATGF